MTHHSIEEFTKGYGFGVRHIQSLLMFLCVATGYIMRVDMSVAIIAMTDNSTSSEEIEIFHWSKQTQDIILSSFFWGYTITQIPAGQLAEKYGIKIILIFAMLANGSATVITPWAAGLGGWKALCGCRVIQGLTQAILFPSIQIFTSKWIPNNERSRLGNFIYTGTSIGTIVGMPLSSLLSSTSIGWPCIFYVIGALGMIVGILFWIFGANSPGDHKTISQEERQYIELSLKNTNNRKVLKTPWKSILTSMPVIAIAVTHIGTNWGFLTLLTQTPTYLKRALGIDVKKSGIISALPYTAMWISSIILSYISDYVVNHEICNMSVARKFFNSIGSFGPAVGLICLGFLPRGSEIAAIAILTLSVGCVAGMYMGYMMSYIDMAPNFSGTIMSITNCAANGVGMLAPNVVGMILKDDTDLKQWRIVFISVAAVYIVTNIFYLIFATSEKQPWNDPSSSQSVNNVDRIRQPSANIENEAMLSSS